MRYSLRLLLIALALSPPLLAWGYQRWTTPNFELSEDDWNKLPQMHVYFDTWEEYEQWNANRAPNDGMMAIVHVPDNS